MVRHRGERSDVAIPDKQSGLTNRGLPRRLPAARDDGEQTYNLNNF